MFRAFWDKITFSVSAGDDKHIERDSYPIQPPVDDDFKLIIDREWKHAYYQLPKTLLRFQLPENIFEKKTDGEFVLKGVHLVDSESGISQTLLLQNYVIVLHVNNLITIYDLL